MPDQSPLDRLAADALQFREHGPNYHEAEDLEDPALPLYAQQREIPRLPVPPLRETADKYLASLEPLLTDAELARSAGADRRLDAHVRRTRELIGELSRDDARDARARELVTALALAVQGSLLVRAAPPSVADAFIGSRLGGDGHLYGVLPPGTDAASIAARA